MTKRMWMALISLTGLFLGTYLTLYKFGFIGSLACKRAGGQYSWDSRWPPGALGFTSPCWC
jgi:hypothetical protein